MTTPRRTFVYDRHLGRVVEKVREVTYGDLYVALTPATTQSIQDLFRQVYRSPLIEARTEREKIDREVAAVFADEFLHTGPLP